MAKQTITAMFPTRAEADRAAEALRTDLKLAPGAVSVLADEAGGGTGVATTATASVENLTPANAPPLTGSGASWPEL